MVAPTIPTTGLAKVISGLYRIPAIRIDFDCAFTNTVPVDAIRGAGKPEALFLLERLVDIAAHETGRTPPSCVGSTCSGPARCPTPRPAATPTMRPTARGCSRRRWAAADAPGFAARRAASEAAGKRRGLGLSCHLHGTGGVADEHVVVEVEPDRLVASIGTQSQGQGHETVFAQILAESLGVPVERIDIRQGDTRTDPARRRHRRLVLDHHQRHDAQACRRRGDRARPRDRRRAAGGGAGRHRLPRRQLRGRGHRPPHRPVRAGRRQAVRRRRACSPTRSSPSRPA